eukprot:1183357-Prorocentrum_minimum.AAC.3
MACSPIGPGILTALSAGMRRKVRRAASSVPPLRKGASGDVGREAVLTSRTSPSAAATTAPTWYKGLDCLKHPSETKGVVVEYF